MVRFAVLAVRAAPGGAAALRPLEPQHFTELIQEFPGHRFSTPLERGSVVEHLREYLADLQDELEWDSLFKRT